MDCFSSRHALSSRVMSYSITAFGDRPFDGTRFAEHTIHGQEWPAQCAQPW